MLVDVPKLLAALGVRDYEERRGELWACCPMPPHSEAKASWSIVNDPSSPKHGLHRCFGCKRSGAPADLVAAVIGITHASARRWIAANGCVLDEATPDTLPGRVRCAVVEPEFGQLQLPAGVVVGKPFRDWPGVARAYLATRGIGAWQVEHHGIGYAVSGEQRGRIVFPVRNQYGTLLYYTGRDFVRVALRYRSADEQQGAKPKFAIFGEHLWPQRSPAEVYGAEGAIKVLAVERAMCGFGSGEGGPAIAGFNGSELHDEQVSKLRRFDRMTYVADPGETGERFARELEGKLCGAIAVRVVVPPGDHEADTLTRRELRALLG